MPSISRSWWTRFYEVRTIHFQNRIAAWLDCIDQRRIANSILRILE